jgi:hypothetical protein
MRLYNSFPYPSLLGRRNGRYLVTIANQMGHRLHVVHCKVAS